MATLFINGYDALYPTATGWRGVASTGEDYTWLFACLRDYPGCGWRIELPLV